MYQWIIAAALVFASAPAFSDEEKSLSQILTHTFKYNFETPSTIDISELKSGCQRRDCIRSIDQPRFTHVEDTQFMRDDDQLVLLSHSGITRAYPKKILNFREIVNDHFGDTPVVVTYCPLCASGIAYVADINGQATEFGISGMLYNNDLVMYDRQTNQLWNQILGEVIVGPDAGTKLERLQVQHISWADLKQHHPKAEILAPDARDKANIRRFPTGTQYGDYDTSDRLLYPVSTEDKRLSRKAVVYGIIVDGQAAAIDQVLLRKQKSYSHTINQQKIRFSLAEDGGVTATRIESGNTVQVLRTFWFAWYAFYSDTELIK